MKHGQHEAASLFFLIFFILALCHVRAENKYSKEANVNMELSSADLEEPFRMGRINQVWKKAKKVLSRGKLESLFSELTLHDKQELTWKRMKNEGGDKEGTKEAQLRTQLLGILDRYGIGRYAHDVPKKLPLDVRSNELNDSSPGVKHGLLFKDKKLNRLWEKAEKAGFSEVELKALHEEFQHHQDKIDEYYSLMEEQSQAREQMEEMSNQIHYDDSVQAALKSKSQMDYKARINEVHDDLQRGYDRLHVASVNGPDTREFTEPKVDGLWKMALKGDFTEDELESLRTELKHYEERIRKLRHVQTDMLASDSRHGPNKPPTITTEGRKVYEKKIKLQERQVEKLQTMLEEKILSRHTEL